jgi:hypothetical protein
MTSSPDPRRRPTSDELVAMFVALLGIGSVLFWGLTRSDGGLDLGSLSGLLDSPPTSTQPPNPLSDSPSPNASIGSTTPANSGTGQPSATIVPPQVSLPVPTPSTPSTGAIAPVPPAPAPEIAAPVSPDPTLPNLVPSPTTPPLATGPTGFSDVPQSYWAGGYIAELTRRKILDGFPDGTFQPDKPITRAEFAGLVGRAFDKPKIRQNLAFQDLATNYWAKGAIDEAVETGFLSGYPNGVFKPDQQIPIFELQMAMVAGLQVQPQAPTSQTLGKFEDANTLPNWAQDKIAAAVEAGLMTGFPSPQKLTPNRVATRADAAAIIYQALVREGRVTPP